LGRNISTQLAIK